ncbi:signal peptide peptidase SppA [Pyrococcus sp. ST04]|uniref:signal peptide peptidase SppA n=1 Tax=Pyrococcus sp. ST04 TaxID=1183377 RepID=UPI0002605D02|nr:signal peptide peptidase SppA [Pyrococcus sp. ST04]AFK23031.1 putative protease IV [Pyrococcus sp. ST04]
MSNSVWKYVSFILMLILALSIVTNALLYIQIGEIKSQQKEIVVPASNLTENKTLSLKIQELKREIEFLRSLVATKSKGGNMSIAIVPIFGPIDNYMALNIVKIIREIRDNSSIGGVLLWIESPGGYVGPVRVIYEELKKLSYVKPIVAYTGSYADSGAYYIACAAEKIIADPLAEVGSIGVLYVHFNAEEYYKMNGIKVEVFKTGPYKDMGADWRGLTPEERRIIKDQIETYFNEFLEVVSEGRNMSINETRKFANGLAWFAKDVNGTLVDELGDLDSAIRELLKLMNVTSANVVMYSTPPENFEITESSSLYMPAKYVYGYIRR